jgi:hypothetical protein
MFANLARIQEMQRESIRALEDDEFLKNKELYTDTPIDRVWYDRFILFKHTYAEYFASVGLKFIVWEHNGQCYIKFVRKENAPNSTNT